MTLSDMPGDDLDKATLQILHKAGVERQELGERLARHEYQAMRRELMLSDPFHIDVQMSADNPEDGRSRTPPPPVPELLPTTSVLKALPTLRVPLGRIAWVNKPEDLPVTGILIENSAGPQLAPQLLSLLTEHHRNPFSRLVFLCRDLPPVHFLGRYGFVCQHIENAAIPDIGEVFLSRFGMSQIRALDGGQKLWEPA